MGVYLESRSPQLFVKQLVIDYFSLTQYNTSSNSSFGGKLLAYAEMITGRAHPKYWESIQIMSMFKQYTARENLKLCKTQR